ncbi:MAG: 23S rRNA (pseudouridine(1915)-N(3))-methyltransferase RlmH [Thermodesulfobacteriota bacterium]
MLRIKLIVVDRTRLSFLQEGEAFYMQRIRRYAPLEWVEVRPARMTKGRSGEEILRQEAQEILRRLGPQDYPVALDPSGRARRSEELAAWLGRLSEGGVEWLSFIIGGPLGLSEEVRKHSREVLSLSPLTLTHEMCRLLLLEQLYRAFTILRGEKYHK